MVTKQPAGVALVRKEAVRKLVRTDTKGAWLSKQATVNKDVNTANADGEPEKT